MSSEFVMTFHPGDRVAILESGSKAILDKGSIQDIIELPFPGAPSPTGVFSVRESKRPGVKPTNFEGRRLRLIVQ